MSFSLEHSFTNQLTQVPNAFIDAYMPYADGSFVKIYLYLLRQAQDRVEKLSIEDIADALNNTESDVLRALHYWENTGLIHLTFQGTTLTSLGFAPVSHGDVVSEVHSQDSKDDPRDSKDDPRDSKNDSRDSKNDSKDLQDRSQDSETPSITMLHNRETHVLDKTDAPIASNAARSTGAPYDESETSEIPMPQDYSSVQTNLLCQDPDVKDCIRQVEKILGNPVSQPHLKLIVYLMCDLSFSKDLTVSLYEVGLERGVVTTHYLLPIARDWYDQKITTPEEARRESSSSYYSKIIKALGLDRNLATSEIKMVEKWHNQYHFSEEIILEACERAIKSTNKGSVAYTDKILSNWYQDHVKTREDILAKDREFHRNNSHNYSSPSSIQKVRKGSFHDFEQRQYSSKDYEELEKKLLRK